MKIITKNLIFFILISENISGSQFFFTLPLNFTLQHQPVLNVSLSIQTRILAICSYTRIIHILILRMTCVTRVVGKKSLFTEWFRERFVLSFCSQIQAVCGLTRSSAALSSFPVSCTWLLLPFLFASLLHSPMPLVFPFPLSIFSLSTL